MVGLSQPRLEVAKAVDQRCAVLDVWLDHH
jgi:hypothetical protein